MIVGPGNAYVAEAEAPAFRPRRHRSTRGSDRDAGHRRNKQRGITGDCVKYADTERTCWLRWGGADWSRRQIRMMKRMTDLVFEAIQEADGGYCAECLTENIFTQGNTWDELRMNVIDATTAFFFDKLGPRRIRLHLVRDEVLCLASAESEVRRKIISVGRSPGPRLTPSSAFSRRPPGRTRGPAQTRASAPPAFHGTGRQAYLPIAFITSALYCGAADACTLM